MIHFTQCPICGGSEIMQALTAKDYTVSQKEFSIYHCNSCSVRFTQDIPSEDEIGAYYASADYVSHSDTKKGIVNKLYHWVRRRTLVSKRKMAQRFTGLPKGKVLDIGCGTGAYLHEMERSGWQVTGLEPDINARIKAQELYSIDPQEPSALYQLDEKTYDVISMWHVLEHVHDLQGYLQKISSLLSANGKLFIAVPNYTSKDAAVYKEFWAAWDVPRHLYHFSPGSMEILLKKFDLKIIAYKPMWYDSFYVSMLSEKYKTGKTNLIKAIWNGFVSNLNAFGNRKKCSSVIYVVARG
jgi:SAM-dependent methyltransferase